MRLQWRKDGQLLGDSSSDGVLRVRDVRAEDAGEYVCVAMADRFINVARVSVTLRGWTMQYHSYITPSLQSHGIAEIKTDIRTDITSFRDLNHQLRHSQCPHTGRGSPAGIRTGTGSPTGIRTGRGKDTRSLS